MEVYYVIGLDADWKPQHTMRIASREPVTQDNISAAFKNVYAKVVIAQEVSGMGVAVGGEKSDRQAALEALDRFDGMTFNGNIDAWQKLGQILDGHRKTIRAALIAQDVNVEWFFRWIARGKANYAGMSMEQCADMIWHHPHNPYMDNNPWADRAEQKGQSHE